MSKSSTYILATTLMLFTLLGSQAMAHKVNLFAYAEGMDVFVEGYFVDGKAAQNSTVKVYTAADELLQEGVTDAEGQYQFSLSNVADLKIILNAGMGHQTEFMLSADDLGLGLGELSTEPLVQNNVLATENRSVEQDSDSAPVYSAEDIKALVYMAVKEANKPLVRELSAAQEKASLSSLLGGIGYIVGFLGLFAFFKAKQMIKEVK